MVREVDEGAGEVKVLGGVFGEGGGTGGEELALCGFGWYVAALVVVASDQVVDLWGWGVVGPWEEGGVRDVEGVGGLGAPVGQLLRES